MRIIELNETYLQDFISFCQLHRHKVDESYLSDVDLNTYSFVDNLTYLVIENESVIGVCSLMKDSYYLKGKKLRFRIFYGKEACVYPLLWTKILEVVHDVNQVFLFLSEENKEEREIITNLGFSIERYSFLFKRDTSKLTPDFNEDYQIKPFQFNRDEIFWCDVINKSFNFLTSHISDVTEDMVNQLQHQDGFLDTGLMMLYHRDFVIGVLSVSKDEYNGESVAYVGPIAIIPTYQRQGLGTKLLETAIAYAWNHKYKKIILSVNAENDHALGLYIREGFEKIHVAISYCYNINRGELNGI